MSEIVLTGDGSHSIYVKELDEHYHSVHGALAESSHVFIKEGLKSIQKNDVRIMEMGLGTGLNAFLTLLEGERSGQRIEYWALEKYPVTRDVTDKLNYPDLFTDTKRNVFPLIHDCPWNEINRITDRFSLEKILADIRTVDIAGSFDLVYYDAFSPGKQPELWTDEIFRKVFNAMAPGGLLTTYTSKSDVRRAMTSVGFAVEKLPGPSGKREMVRARKDLGL